MEVSRRTPAGEGKGRTEWYSDFAVRIAKVEDARISERSGRPRQMAPAGRKCNDSIVKPKDPHTARSIVNVQRPAYEREAEIIQFQGIPQLNETVFDVMDSRETFIGSFEGKN